MQIADKGVRVAGFIIDWLPTLLLIFLLTWIPIVGIIVAGLILVPYWLLRDMTGRSLGKTLLGMEVVLKDGSPAPVGALIIRNLPLIVGPACMIIPFLGYLAWMIQIPILLIELILLLSQGNRMGDVWAGTTVIRTAK